MTRDSRRLERLMKAHIRASSRLSLTAKAYDNEWNRQFPATEPRYPPLRGAEFNLENALREFGTDIEDYATFVEDVPVYRPDFSRAGMLVL